MIRRVSFLEGRSISIGKNLSFHPIIDLFKQWAKIKEGDRQIEASKKLETAIRRVCGDETDEVFPFVAILMGMKLSGKHSQRVEGMEGEALVNNMLQVKGLPYTVKQQIVDRSGGNPFFMEEIVRSLIDEGAIVHKNRAFEVTAKIDHVVIPETVNDMLMARIDRLEEETRNLIKVASVIGRNFFDRILKDVAAYIEEIDERLAYLKDAEFIRDRMRMEELKYLFKHELAQEAAYKSTLIQQRKMLHWKVAKSIEKIFQEHLHEFYGMLAFHYSKADELEKAEKYMEKAGDEALRSSASSEALHYYQEALRLYLSKYGNDTDPAKLSTFEKNIGIALFNKAQWPRAVDYFEKVLERWRVPSPKRGFFGIVRLVWDLIVVIKMIYLKLPNSKKAPKGQDLEAIELYYRTGLALTYVDSTRQFQVAVAALRHTANFELSKVPNVSGYWIAAACSFSVGRLSFKISNRLLEVSQQFRIRENVGHRMQYIYFTALIHHCQDDWGKIKNLDESLLNASLRRGDFWTTSAHLFLYGLLKMEQGDFQHALKIIDKIHEIGEAYDYPNAITGFRSLRVRYLVMVRRPNEAMSETEQGLVYFREKGPELMVMLFMALKSEAQQLAGDSDMARDSISKASEIYEKQSSVVTSQILAPYLAARFFVDVEQLKHAIRSQPSSDVPHIRRHAYASGKAAIRISSKYAPYRRKILRLMGLYFWLIGKQGTERHHSA